MYICVCVCVCVSVRVCVFFNVLYAGIIIFMYTYIDKGVWACLCDMCGVCAFDVRPLMRTTWLSDTKWLSRDFSGCNAIEGDVVDVAAYYIPTGKYSVWENSRSHMLPILELFPGSANITAFVFKRPLRGSCKKQNKKQNKKKKKN